MKISLYQELISLIKKKGYSLTEEVKIETDQLSQVIEAQKMSDIVPVLKWLKKKRKSPHIKVEEIGIKDLKEWSVDQKTGNILHRSGKFLS